MHLLRHPSNANLGWINTAHIFCYTPSRVKSRSLWPFASSAGLLPLKSTGPSWTRWSRDSCCHKENRSDRSCGTWTRVRVTKPQPGTP